MGELTATACARVLSFYGFRPLVHESRLAWRVEEDMNLLRLVCWVCCVLIALRVADAALNYDGQLLLQFQASVSSDPYQVLANWNPNDPDPCNWTGVSCSTNVASPSRVISLNLPRAQLQGSIAPQLGGLLQLRHLNFHHNYFQGSIPPQLFNATQLKSLFLFSNRLSGPLPPQIGQLYMLQNVDLSGNSLTGIIPSTISKCTSLRSLRIGHNAFVGSIPEEVGTTLRGLRTLDLSFNLLNGSIPSSLSQLQDLEILTLSHNHLSGTIPPSLEDLSPSLVMDVSYNDLRGSIPSKGPFPNQTQAAFLGNRGLCGAPLPISCVAPAPYAVHESSPGGPRRRTKGLISKAGIAAIAVGDVAAIGLIFFTLLYCFRTKYEGAACPAPGSSSASPDEAGIKAINESHGEEEDMQHGELVAVDDEMVFNLDELLQASAYVLGKSEVGIVYKVIVSDHLTLAVRRLGDGGADKLKEFQAEVRTIADIHHPNMVRLRAYYWAPDEKLLIYDYIPNGNLAAALEGPLLIWSRRLQIARGVARALAYIHDQKCVHADIKPSNVLLDMDMRAYIADFGLTRLVELMGSGVPASKLGKRHPAVSRPDAYYHAPEKVASASRPQQTWDIYSFGILLLHLLTGTSRLPPSSADVGAWINAALEGKTPLSLVVDAKLVDDVHLRSHEMLALLRIAHACVQSPPSQRASMRHVSWSVDTLGHSQ